MDTGGTLGGMPATRASRRQARYQLTVELPLAGAPGWHVAGTYIDTGGKLTLAALAVIPGHDRDARRAGEWEPRDDAFQPGLPDLVRARPLTKTLLSELPLADLTRLANQMFTANSGDDLVDRLRPRLKRATVHPGQAVPDAEYLLFARRYAELIAAGETRYRQQMANDFKMTPEQIRERVRECRRRGLLTPATHGSASGSLTPKAQRMLDTK
jgi:hypothetical protein